MFTATKFRLVCCLVFCVLVIATAARAATINDLIALYDFDGDANDSSGNDYHATLNGGATVTGAGYLSSSGNSLDLLVLKFPGREIPSTRM
jgi:hypothetical protein